MKCVQTPEVEEDQKDSMKKKNKLRERIDKVMVIIFEISI